MKTRHTISKPFLLLVFFGFYVNVSPMSLESARQDRVADYQHAGNSIRAKRNASRSIVDGARKAIEEGDPTQVKRTYVTGSNQQVYNDAEQRVSVIEVAGSNPVVTNERADQVSLIKITGSNAQVTNDGSAEVSDIRVYGSNGHVVQRNVTQLANVTVIGSNPWVQAFACQSHIRVVQMSHDRDQNPYVLEVEEWTRDGVLVHTERMTNYGTRTIEESGFTRSLSDPEARGEPTPRNITRLPDPDDAQATPAP